MPVRQEPPSTLERAPDDARRAWIEAHDSAVEQYGEGERAHRVAFGALKHTYEKVGDQEPPVRGGAAAGRAGPVPDEQAGAAGGDPQGQHRSRSRRARG